MSKKSIICTILALSLILAGTGYAYWTDTLNVTTKATTGDFNVTFVDLGLYAQYDNEYKVGPNDWSIIDGVGTTGYVPANFFMRGSGDYNVIAAPGTIDQYHENAKGYNNVEFDAELVNAQKIDKTVGPYVAGVVNGSSNILLTVDNMYPGYAQAFRTDILNLGSIAARLSKINFSITQNGSTPINDTTRNMLGVALLVEREYMLDPSEHGNPVFQLCKALNLPDSAIFEIGNVHFIRLSALNSVSKEVLSQYDTLLTLPSENRMDLYIAVAMDPDAEGKYTTGSTKVMANNDDSKSQRTGAKISIDLLWDQFNEGINPNTTNILADQNHTP